MTNNKGNEVHQLHVQKSHHLTAVTGAGVLLGSTILLGQQTKPVHAATTNDLKTDANHMAVTSATSQHQLELHSATSQSSNASQASQQTSQTITNKTAQSPLKTMQVTSVASVNNAKATSAVQHNVKSTASQASLASSTVASAQITSQQVSHSSIQSQATHTVSSSVMSQQTTSQAMPKASQTNQQVTSQASAVSQSATKSVASQQPQQSDNTKAQDLARLQSLLQAEANYAASGYQEAFIEQIADAAIAIANKYDLYPSVMMAQAILESGWGQSWLSTSAHNYFGVKGSYNGQSVDVPTQEWNGSQMITINDYFKKYPNAEASFEDYAQVFVGSAWARNFYRGVFRNNAPTYQDATAWLTGRYATDPNYNVKLNQIIQQYDLTRFDQQTGNTPANPAGVVDTDNTDADTSKPQGQKTYIVHAGDTVWGISQKFDTTVNNIVAWNNLSNQNLIYVGQVLNVSAPQTNSTDSDHHSQQSTTNNDDQTITYTVKAGDTVSGIAQSYHVSVDQIARLSHLQNKNLIYVGQVLTIKEGKASQNNTQNQTPQNNDHHDNNNVVTYTVKAGDTLWGISQKYNTTVSQLQHNNNLNGSTIYVGQVLTISGQSHSSMPNHNSSNAPTSQNNNSTYTVKAGDTLWGISQKYNTTVNQLMSANHLSDTTIYVGQTLDVAPVSSGNVTLSRPSAQNSAAYYTAKAGDSLWSIAQTNNTSVAALKQLNGLSSDMILVGQRLRIR
ncbi:MAG: LysM peptidoglycan-binding domain-containing protein [Candidatus Paralactobacillus gallistercoris]|uniref:Peptidoglycan hydrolase n=1 Tax=Candidatus Paralactobacillus gallistercoris TaxID=2838724 RepID=A0A948TI30_9LACO|nr:LysM peptidoglycan-binding domain-containing protein [Candidatus Paralactobacillus gallistercoris]